jgi:hypothetical protein
MVFVLVKSPNSFTVDEEYLELFTLVLSLQSVSPDP